MEADPGANTPILVAQLENLASWSSTIETSRGWTEDALIRHCRKDSRQWLAEAATVGPFSSGLGPESAMMTSLPDQGPKIGPRACFEEPGPQCSLDEVLGMRVVPQ
jgi:hypothetical protein